MPDAGPMADAGPMPDAGPARITLDQPSYSFGALAPGSPATHDFTVTNVGGMTSGALDVTMTGNGTGSFTLDASACQGHTLEVGTGCTVSVTFATATPATKMVTLVVSAIPGGMATSSLDGSGLAPAALSSDPPSVDFGNVTNGSSSTNGITIRNGGALATGSLTVVVSGTDAARYVKSNDTCGGKTLGASSSCTLSITFSPSTTGAKSAKVSVGDGTKNVDVALTGAGVAPGALSFMPQTPTFDSVAIGGSSTASLSVKNTGGTTVTGLSTSISGTSASDYTFMTNGCNGMDLAGGASCSLVVKFHPTVAGQKSASLSVSSTSGGSATTSLSATATAHLSVLVDGTGHGTVTSTPPAISCGTTCDVDFAATSVLLKATPNSDSTFGGWMGGGCSGTIDTCNVSLSTAQTVHATFTIKKYTFTIAKAGTGTGTVTSSAGINCGSGAGCMVDIVAGTSVLLNQTPGAHDRFDTWSGGGCTGTGACLITVNGPVTITASYTRLFTLTASILASQPSGRVFSNPAGIDCNNTSTSGTTCSSDFAPGTTVTLSNDPGSQLLFGEWGGDCVPSGLTGEQRLLAAAVPQCALTMNADHGVVAVMGDPVTLTVTVNGTFKVNSIPLSTAGLHAINCQGPATCSATFSALVEVGFQAKSGTSPINVSWSATTSDSTSCGPSNSFCDVTMSSFPIGHVASQTFTVSGP